MNKNVSIIIPALNEASEIGKTLSAVGSLGRDIEIIVADGGSTDGTTTIARQFNAIVVEAKRGRGGQMHAGANLAKGDILWFLHADSLPSANALREMCMALNDPETVGGNFILVFAGESSPARFMTWFYSHLRKIGLMYGDSGIFVRRSAYERISGFKPLPLFEDLDLVNRMRNEGELITLKAEIVTSSRRFEGRAFAPVFLRWVIFQCLYWVGVSPFWMAKRYYPDTVVVDENPSEARSKLI